MSHILRSRFGGGKRAAQGGNVVPRRVNGEGSRKPQGSQVQQQVLRRPTMIQEHMQVQNPQRVTTPHQQQVQTDRNKVIQETLEDVKVLEELQQEAQRRLEYAKLARQNQLDQRASLETQLTMLKYSNGEKRAQIARAHELLSSSHRELTALRTASDRNGDGIRRMEIKLRKGLEARCVAGILQQQVQLRISLLMQKEHLAEQMHAKVLEKLEAIENRCQEQEQRQQALAKARQDELARIQKLAETTANARTEGVQLEQQLTIARQQESAARQRAEEVSRELAAEDKRSSAAFAKLNERLRNCEAKKATVGAKQLEQQREIDGKKDALQELRVRLLTYRDGDAPLESVSADAVLEQLQQSVEREQQALENQLSTKSRLEVSLEKLLLEKSEKEKAIVSLNESCQCASQRLREGEALEEERRTAAELRKGDLAKMRDEVNVLRTDLSQLLKTKEEARTEGETLLDEQTQLHQRQLDAVALLLQELGGEKGLLEDLNKSYLEADEENQRKVDQAKSRRDAAQKLAELLRDEAVQIPSEEDFKMAVQEEIESIKLARAFMASDIKGEIGIIRKKYSPLSDTEIVGDPRKTTEELAREVFGNVFAKCDEVLRRARQRQYDEDRKRRDAEDQKQLDDEDRKRRDAEDWKQRDDEARKRRDAEDRKQRDDETRKRRDGASRKQHNTEAKKQRDDEAHKQRDTEARNQRKVTFQKHSMDLPQAKTEPRTKRELAQETARQPKEEVFEIESDQSESSPFVQAELNSFTHTLVPEQASEAKPRVLLPAFTQASLDEDSVAFEDAKRVHWDPNEDYSEPAAANDSSPGRPFDNNKPKTRRSYGATKFGNGRILMKRKSAKVLTRTSPIKNEAPHDRQSALFASVDSKYESQTVGLDQSLVKSSKVSHIGVVTKTDKASAGIQKGAESRSLGKQLKERNEGKLATGLEGTSGGSILRHHRPAEFSSTTSLEKVASHGQRSSNVYSDEVKDKYRKQRKSVGRDHSFELDKTSDFGDDSNDVVARGVDELVNNKLSDSKSISTRKVMLHEPHHRDTKREQLATTREGSAKKQRTIHLAKADRKESVDQKGKASRVLRDEVLPEAKLYDSKWGQFDEVGSGAKKRKEGVVTDQPTKRYRNTAAETILGRGRNSERFREVSNTTQHKASSKSNARDNGKVQQTTKGSTQTSGISSMERVPPRRPKKKLTAPNKASRGLARLDDIEEYNFHPRTS